jgi:putative FmdB family regulatory protein
MPKTEYLCRKCKHGFQQMLFRGDKALPVKCPRCGSRDLKISETPEGLFDGIASFSSLNQDYN